MNKRFHSFSRLAALSGLFLGSLSCKENTILNANVLPAGDSLNTITLPDTFTVQAYTVNDDTVVTEYQKIIAGTNRVVGSAYMGAGIVSSDPFFGKTFAALGLEPSPPTANFTFGNNPRIDSAVLVLPYSGFSWGDTVSAPAIRYRVYRLSAALTGADTFLYSSYAASVDRTKTFSEKTTYFADLKDSVVVRGVKKAPHLRIPLDLNSFLPALNEGIAASSTLPGFVAAFKGLYVEPDATQGGSFIPYFSFLTGNDLYQRPGIVVYYKNDANDSAVASFPFQASVGKAYTHIRRDYAGTPAYDFVKGNGGNPNLLLLQNEPGAAIEFKMPYVKSLPRAVYNRAQLILTALDTAASNQYFAPFRIFPERINENGRAESIADRLPEGSTEASAFVDGTVRTVSVGGVSVRQYVINFPRELQRAVSSGRDVLHLRINGYPGLPGAYRLIAGSRTHPLYRLRLQISYSKI